jgi:hypothetical protein
MLIAHWSLYQDHYSIFINSLVWPSGPLLNLYTLFGLATKATALSSILFFVSISRALFYPYILFGCSIRTFTTLYLYTLWSHHQGQSSIFINSLAPTSGPALYFYTLLGFKSGPILYHYIFYGLAIRSKCPIFIHSLVSKSEPLLYLYTLFGLAIRVTFYLYIFYGFANKSATLSLLTLIHSGLGKIVNLFMILPHKRNNNQKSIHMSPSPVLSLFPISFFSFLIYFNIF